MNTNASFVTALRKAMRSKKTRKLPRRKPIKLFGSRESEFWKFERNGVSVSALEVWLACHEQFRLRYVEGLRCPKSSAALDYGNLWHWLLARSHDPSVKKGMNLDGQLKIVDAAWRADNPLPAVNRLQDWHVSLAQTKALWPVYARKFKDDWNRKWVGVETPFRVPFEVKGSKTVLHGIWDGVYEDKLSKSLWLREIKTKSQIDEFEIEDTLHLDNQVMMYLWTIWLQFKRMPVGVEYNVIRKPGIRLKAGENLDAYSKRVGKEVQKDEDHYFKRWHLTVTVDKLKEWVDMQFSEIIWGLREWAVGNAPHWINTKALIGKYGRCEMFDVITKGDLTGVSRRQTYQLEKDR